MTDAVRITDLRIRYGKTAHPVLSIDSLHIARGAHVAVIGPSGSGKTTLLRALHGLVRPDAGEISVHGVALAAKAARTRGFRRRNAAVFQEFQLVERASVLRNVLCGRLGQTAVLPSLLGVFGAADRRAAIQAIEATGLAEFAFRRVDALSGGQRQRVAVARALAQQAELITADEPVSNLDPVLADDVLRLVMGQAREREATAIAVVHHPDLAAGHAERIIGLVDGRIVFDSTDGAALDAAALRRIYGRSLAPRIVRDLAPGDHERDLRNPPSHVA